MSIRHFTRGKIQKNFIESYRYKEPGEDNPGTAAFFSGLKSLKQNIDSSLIDKNKKIPQNIITDLFRIGAFSFFVPDAFNGLNADMYDFCMGMKAASLCDVSIAASLVPHNGMGVKSILLFANEKQQSEIFSDFIEKQKIIAFALTETMAGSDVENHITSLRSVNGDLFLDGIKHFITNTLNAKIIVVVAKCPDLSKIPGGSAFVYLRPDDEGIVFSKAYDKFGMRGSIVSELMFNNVKLSPDRIIGQPGKAIQQFNKLVDSGRLGVAAVSYGILEKAYGFLLKENGTRKGFNSRLIEQIGNRLFEMEAVLAIGASSHDYKLQDSILYTALTKIYCTETSWELLNEISDHFDVDAFGRNNQIFQLFRENPILRITEGPNDVLIYRTGLDLITSSIIHYTGEAAIAYLVDSSLAPCAEKFAGLLASFSLFIANIKESCRNFSRNQLVLNRVTQAAKYLYVMFACLLYYSRKLKRIKASSGTVNQAAVVAHLNTTCRNAEKKFYVIIEDKYNTLDDYYINHTLKTEYILKQKMHETKSG